MKRVYEKPAAFVEAFAAEEYVAACYYLACRVGSEGSFDPWWNKDKYLWKTEEKGGGITHATLGTGGTCADKHANRVITDDGGIFQHVQENNSAKGGQGWIDGGYDDYIDINKNGKMDAGDWVYWHTTNAAGDRKWNHYGILEQADANHPNHS